jgi:hypothetical protein
MSFFLFFFIVVINGFAKGFDGTPAHSEATGYEMDSWSSPENTK